MFKCEFHGTFEHETKCPECEAAETDANREMFGDCEIDYLEDVGCK